MCLHPLWYLYGRCTKRKILRDTGRLDTSLKRQEKDCPGELREKERGTALQPGYSKSLRKLLIWKSHSYLILLTTKIVDFPKAIKYKHHIHRGKEKDRTAVNTGKVS